MKPFAILKLNDLKIMTFDHEDEFKIALQNLEAAGVNTVALKWNAQANLYVVQEQWRS